MPQERLTRAKKGTEISTYHGEVANDRSVGRFYRVRARAMVLHTAGEPFPTIHTSEDIRCKATFNIKLAGGNIYFLVDPDHIVHTLWFRGMNSTCGTAYDTVHSLAATCLLLTSSSSENLHCFKSSLSPIHLIFHSVYTSTNMFRSA